MSYLLFNAKEYAVFYTCIYRLNRKRIERTYKISGKNQRTNEIGLYPVRFSGVRTNGNISMKQTK